MRTLLVLCALAVPIHVGAQVEVPALERAHASLATYDVEGSSTLDVVRELGQYVSGEGLQASPGVLREATFLHAVVATDLLLLHDHFGTDTSVVARAYGVAPDALEEALLEALEPLEGGVYASVVHDARSALQMRLGREVPDRGMGPRAGLMYLSRLRDATQGRDPIAALSSAGQDPCAEDAPCPAPYQHFMANGRAAVAAMQMALSQLNTIEAQGADPFVAALGDTFSELGDALRQTVLHPEPRTDSLAISPAGPREADVQVRAMILIGERDVCFGGWGEVRFDTGSAAVHARTAGVPVLPETECVPLPSQFRPFPTPIPALVAALEPLSGHEHVGVGGAAGAPAHLLSRVWLSAQRAGLVPDAFVARADDGHVAAVHAQAVRGDDPSAIQVHLRLGGHTVAVRGARARMIPRRPSPNGLRFDYETLESLARETRSTSVRYMHSVPFASLSATAFHVAPRQTPVTFVLP